MIHPPSNDRSSPRRSKSRQAAITRAVHAHLKSTRAPGTPGRANTAQIAEALSLPRRAVDRALLSLKQRHVDAKPGDPQPVDLPQE